MLARSIVTIFALASGIVTCSDSKGSVYESSVNSIEMPTFRVSELDHSVTVNTYISPLGLITFDSFANGEYEARTFDLRRTASGGLRPYNARGEILVRDRHHSGDSWVGFDSHLEAARGPFTLGLARYSEFTNQFKWFIITPGKFIFGSPIVRLGQFCEEGERITTAPLIPRGRLWAFDAVVETHHTVVELDAIDERVHLPEILFDMYLEQLRLAGYEVTNHYEGWIGVKSTHTKIDCKTAMPTIELVIGEHMFRIPPAWFVADSGNEYYCSLPFVKTTDNTLVLGSWFLNNAAVMFQTDRIAFCPA
jgi:hypothetical protein